MDKLLTQELSQFVRRADGRINSVKLTEQCFSRNNKLHLWKYLHEATSQFTIPLSLGDRVFLLEAGIEKESLCKICNSNPRIIVAHDGPKRYSKYCSQACAARERENKIVGCQSRDETASADKRRTTMLAKYGVPYNSIREDLKHIWKQPKTYLNRDALEKAGNDYDHLLQPGVVELLWKEHPTLGEMAKKLNVNIGNVYTLFKTVGFAPKFEKNSSSQERKIRSLLENLNVSMELNNRKIISPQELDIFIPEKKVAIEINGHFWHRSERIGTTYHIKKMKKCEDAGISLLQFWDNDIDDKFDIVSSIILNKIGLSNQTKYDARKLKINIIDTNSSSHDKDKVKKFFIDNHIQGSCNFKIAATLTLDNEIISCMTFSHKRFMSKNDNIKYELSRFANKRDTIVRGGASKLFQHLVKKYNIDAVISYSDNFISMGKLYEILGFSYSHMTEPAYFWVVDNDIIPRYRTRHEQLPGLIGDIYDPELSEAENMDLIGAYKIHNAGNRVWIWRR